MKGLKGFRGGASLKTWLITIARNEALTYLKKEIIHPSLEEVPELAIDYRGKREEEEEMIRYVLGYIHILEEPKKSLMVLRLLNELSFIEIGQILGKSDVWCRVTFMRVKSGLLKEWEEEI